MLLANSRQKTAGNQRIYFGAKGQIKKNNQDNQPSIKYQIVHIIRITPILDSLDIFLCQISLYFSILFTSIKFYTMVK